MVAKDEAYGLPQGMTGIEIVDPTRGRVAARHELAAHLAGAASGRRGVILAVWGVRCHRHTTGTRINLKFVRFVEERYVPPGSDR